MKYILNNFLNNLTLKSLAFMLVKVNKFKYLGITIFQSIRMPNLRIASRARLKVQAT